MEKPFPRNKNHGTSHLSVPLTLVTRPPALTFLILILIFLLLLVPPNRFPPQLSPATNDNHSMKQPPMLAPALKEFHWNELVNLHLELSYCRHRLIQSVNARVTSNAPPALGDLGRLADVDEQLK